jgi:hypothetical protein
MKKILALIVFTTISLGTINAQSTSKVRFGLSINPSINWLSAQNKNKFESNGATFGFGAALNAEIKISQTASFTTGLSFTTQGGNMIYNDTTYYQYSNSELQELKGPIEGNFTNLLQERKTKINYVNLPLGIKLNTPEFGLLKYYGEFGLNLSFRTSSSTEDITTNIVSNEDEVLTNIVNTDDTQFLNMGFNFGVGAEYNIAGTTSLFFTIRYNNNFINMNNDPSKYLYQENTDGEYTKLKQPMHSQAVQFAIGVFF